MRPRLSVNAQTREFLDFLMSSPFLGDLPAPVHSSDRRYSSMPGNCAGHSAHRATPSWRGRRWPAPRELVTP